MDRMDALRAALAEMPTITAELRVRKALQARIPRAARYIISAGDNVWVYCESEKRYFGPYPVLRVDEKQVFGLFGWKEV